jgi:hypothetical protein
MDHLKVGMAGIFDIGPTTESACWRRCKPGLVPHGDEEESEQSSFVIFPRYCNAEIIMSNVIDTPISYHHSYNSFASDRRWLLEWLA